MVGLGLIKLRCTWSASCRWLQADIKFNKTSTKIWEVINCLIRDALRVHLPPSFFVLSFFLPFYFLSLSFELDKSSRFFWYCSKNETCNDFIMSACCISMSRAGMNRHATPSRGFVREETLACLLLFSFSFDSHRRWIRLCFLSFFEVASYLVTVSVFFSPLLSSLSFCSFIRDLWYWFCCIFLRATCFRRIVLPLRLMLLVCIWFLLFKIALCNL